MRRRSRRSSAAASALALPKRAEPDCFIACVSFSALFFSRSVFFMAIVGTRHPNQMGAIVRIAVPERVPGVADRTAALSKK